MNKIISDILKLQNQVVSLDNLIFNKENDILSIQKSLSEYKSNIENKKIQYRQKQAALSLLELKQKKEILLQKIDQFLKNLDLTSYNNKRLSHFLVYKCISNNIGSDNLKILKDLYKNIK